MLTEAWEPDRVVAFGPADIPVVHPLRWTPAAVDSMRRGAWERYRQRKLRLNLYWHLQVRNYEGRLE